VPDVSVVVNTYNRAGQVGKAIETVLSQSGVDLELIVVDDGSTDNTQAVLASLDDARIRVIRQSNRGLSAARNVGAREARGLWLLFLDDDDRLCEGALQLLLAEAAAPSCRVVVGGVRFVDGDGRVLQERGAASMGDVLAGTFLISRTLFHEAGGYLEGMPCSHQTELFIRVAKVLADGDCSASFLHRPVVEVERRHAAGRPQRSPSNAYFGARWLAARHPDQYADPRTRATLETIVAVNAMRIGRAADARRRFGSAVRHDPMTPERYLRLGAAVLSPIGRRVWLRQWDAVPEARRPLVRVRRLAGGDCSHSALCLERDPDPGPDSLFLPWRYRQNRPTVSGSERSWAPDAIDRLAVRLARARRLAPVVNVKSVAGNLGDDEVWDDVRRLRPQLLVCSDMVQRVPDPRRLLSAVRHALSAGSLALIATPDRTRLQGPAVGPPSNPHHIREWSAEEFALLLESCDFEIVRMMRRRKCVAFLVRSATTCALSE
jgi:glycosyl transferase family 2/methyltransferase family protein